MSKLTSALIATLFASSIAFAADAPKADAQTPAVKSTAVAPNAKTTGHKHAKKHAKQAKQAAKTGTSAAAVPATK
jgi:hypothetical protein